MKNIVQLFCLLIFVLQYSQINAQTPEIIDVESAIKHEKALSFDDFADEIEYIPLETTDYNLIGNIDFIKTTRASIFVGTFNPDALYHFDRSGKFLNKIGKKGRGPNEYNYLFKIGLNEIKKEVYVFGSGPPKLLIYNFDGTFKRDLNDIIYPSKIRNEFQAKPFEELEFIYEDYFIVPQCNFNGTTPYSYEVYSHDGKLIKMAVKPIQFTMNSTLSIMNEFSYYTFGSIFFIKENLLNDTLYEVTPSLKFQPKYIFDEGKYRTPVEFRKDFVNFIEKKEFKYIQLRQIFESERYVVFFFIFDKSDRYGYYDKFLKETYTFPTKGIANDYDGGPEFEHVYQKNNELIGSVNAMDLIAHVNSTEFKNSTPKYPEKKKELEQLAKHLDENDNPVLILVKLKE